MASLFKVPDKEISSFTTLLNLPNDQFELLYTSIFEATPTYNVSNFIQNISSKVDNERTSSLLRTLISLYDLALRSSLSIDEVIESIVASLISSLEKRPQKEKTYTEEDFSLLKNRLQKLLNNHDSLGVITQVQKIAFESERCILDTKAFLDVRPIFSINSDDILNNLFLYKLRMRYMNNNSDESNFNFTLDLSDVIKLRDQLDSVIKKSESIKKLFNNSNIKFIDSNPIKE